MTPDLDIYRSATMFLDRHGDGASLHAANRADELLDKGDMDGRRVWLRIQAAVRTLSRDAPDEGEAVH